MPIPAGLLHGQTPAELEKGMPEQLETKILPLLPLTSGVVLPGMVVTIPLETDEARVAAEAAKSHDGLMLLVPRVGTGYARIGTVCKIEDTGRLRGRLEGPRV